ncbi:glycosyltransferase family 1 protein [Collybiopsis luxurians FD-317 M1]|uniref:Glycosyltransferase family 1 protein n=1 Tax=Collybiopsis luxurians FD-317 M1 TaxID=944289 RepID=A0A0D0CD15_9AGAR|nr:glycosyltransferase family 1 protein [Collybiopsis luxurians FD-317 M1]
MNTFPKSFFGKPVELGFKLGRVETCSERTVSVNNGFPKESSESYPILHTMVAKHIVAHNVAAWGPYKPLSAFAVRVLENRGDVHFSVLIQGGMMYKKFMRELDKIPSDHLSEIRPRLHVIDLTGKDINPFDTLPEFATAFEALYSLKPVTCSSTGTVVQGLAPPTVAIIDPFAGYAIDAIRSIAGSSCSVFSWMTAPAGPVLRLCGPEEYGGGGDMSVKVEAEVARTGRDTTEVAKELFDNLITGQVIHIPGVPPVYDYEWYPQEVENQWDHVLFLAGQKYMRITDGTLCVSSSIYEPEALEAAKNWMESMGKQWYTVGPLSLPDSLPPTKAFDEKELLVISFLNRMQSEFGDQSVLFISFGTIYWPAQPEKLWAILDELLSLRKPFILAHSSPLAHVPEEKRRLISESGIGLEMSWSPQEKILSHPATGWFVTHGGWNSTQEALAHRVPVIYWPYSADQPYNAARTCQHNAGFELVEVRTGERGTQRPYRAKDRLESQSPSFSVSAARDEFRQLLGRIEGDEGRVIRANFERLGQLMDKTWNEGNEAKKNLNAFLQRFID